MGVWKIVPHRDKGSLGDIKVFADRCIAAGDSDRNGDWRIDLSGRSHIAGDWDCGIYFFKSVKQQTFCEVETARVSASFFSLFFVTINQMITIKLSDIKKIINLFAEKVLTKYNFRCTIKPSKEKKTNKRNLNQRKEVESNGMRSLDIKKSL